MSAHRRVLSVLAGASALAGVAALPSAAQAGEYGGGGSGCCKPKPPCCAPKRPDVKVPGVTVYPPKVVIMPPSLNVNVNASAKAVASASASANAVNNNNITFFGGGGGGFFASPGVPSAIPSLNVVGAAVQRVPFQASRTQIKTVVIKAVCIDDRLVPHPASQVFPSQDVADSYAGELYRCIAGSRLQITLADWMGKASFDGGSNMECKKGEALWFERGEISCRPQRPARDCNERSLLRRYGVGVKVFKMTRVETYTAYREEVVQTATSGGIVLDGGVGGVVF